MDKLVQDGDIIVVDESCPIGVFDIFVLTYKDTLLCHRCMLRVGRHFMEFGENGKYPHWVSQEKIVGRCIGLIRNNVYYSFGSFSRKYYLHVWYIMFYKWFFLHLHILTKKIYLKILSKLNLRLWELQSDYLLEKSSAEQYKSVSHIRR